MFKNKFFLLFLVLALVAIIYYSFSNGKDFNQKTLEAIQAYKENLLNEAESPIKEKNIEKFSFYKPNESFLLEADFVPAKDSNKSFNLNMTDSTKIEAKLAGKANFSLNGKDFSVLIFEEENNYLFPFTDLTNASETYGGGRYINIEKDDLLGNKITINFNNAHNFYCAYSPEFICPIPPKENLIDLKIEAGEKIYNK